MAGTNRNITGTAITASATARLNYTGPTIANQAYRGLRLFIDVTAGSSAAFKPKFTLQGAIPGTTKFYSVWVSSASTTANTMKVLVYPGIKSSTVTGLGPSTQVGYTKVIGDALPAFWRIRSTHSGSSGSSKNAARATFGIYAEFLV